MQTEDDGGEVGGLGGNKEEKKEMFTIGDREREREGEQSTELTWYRNSHFHAKLLKQGGGGPQKLAVVAAIAVNTLQGQCVSQFADSKIGFY